MVKFKIDDNEYSLPEYLSIENFVKINKINNIEGEDYFAAKLISIITDAPFDRLMEFNYQEINYLASYVLSTIPKDKDKFIDRFELDGIHYGFFPNWRDITFAEFVDMDTISTKKPEELLNLLHILAAVMYRPIVSERSEHDFDIEKYGVETMKQRAELFKKKLDVKYILGAQFFFIKFARRYSTYTLASSIQTISKWQKIKIFWKMRKTIWRLAFRKRSDGSLSSTELLEMILPNISTYMTKK
jgi:hypothetical protein